MALPQRVGAEQQMAAPCQELLNQLRFRLEPADALGGFRDQVNQEFIRSFDESGSRRRRWFADNLDPLLRFDQGFGIPHRLAAAHPFRRKVLQEPVFPRRWAPGLRGRWSGTVSVPNSPLQGQIEPPGPPIGQHRQLHPFLKAVLQQLLLMSFQVFAGALDLDEHGVW